MKSRIDYLTLTIKSETKSFEETLDLLGRTMFLKDLIEKMVDKGRGLFYAHHLSFEHIEFFFTEPEDFSRQGMCIKFSSQGLDYFINYLATLKVDFRHWCQRWRSLVLDGYITKCTRFDYAIDDISYIDGEPPKLTMRKLFCSASNGEIRSRSRISDDLGQRIRRKKLKGDCVVGRTLYIGSRSSERFVRFYDKKSEQLQKGNSVPHNVNTWIRCEAEYHDGASMSAFNAFCDYEIPDFCRYMASALNEQLEFINLDNNNISRCSVKRWWRAFLNGCEDSFKLPAKKPARSALARSLRGLSQYTRVIYSIVAEAGWLEFMKFVANNVVELKEAGKKILKPEIVSDIAENYIHYEQMNAYTNYQYRSQFDDEEFFEHLNIQRNNYAAYFCKRDFSSGFMQTDSFLHKAFMDGQEVLLDGV